MMEIFAERLRELRTEQNLSYRRLGIILSVSEALIRQWEKSICEPNFTMLLRIADHFNTDPNYLLGVDDAP